MCKFCKNLETGNDYDPLVAGEIDVGMFGKMFSDVVMLKNDNEKPALYLAVCLSNSDLYYEKDIEINYCPVCGRNLQNIN